LQGKVKLAWSPNKFEGRLVAEHTGLVPVSATFVTRVLSIDNIASPVRYLGIEVVDAIEIAEKTDIWMSTR